MHIRYVDEQLALAKADYDDALARMTSLKWDEYTKQDLLYCVDNLQGDSDELEAEWYALGYESQLNLAREANDRAQAECQRIRDIRAGINAKYQSPNNLIGFW